MKVPLFNKIVLALNFIIAFGLLVSYFVPFADPRTFVFLAFIGLIYPFLLLANLIFLVYWLITRRFLWVISCVALLLGLGILKLGLEFRLSRSQAEAHSKNHIRVMTYNVHSFKPQNQDYSLPYAKKIFQMVDSFQPDVVCLQEFSFDFYNKKQIFSNLNKACRSDQCFFRSYESTPWDSTGIAIFSRFKILKKGYIFSDQDTTGTQAIFVDLQYNSTTIRIYCIHLQSNHLENDDHLYLQDLEQKGNIKLQHVKLILNKLKLAYVKRSYQASLVKQHIDKCPYPIIITGDFNDTPNSFSVNRISEGLKNAFVERGSGLGFTYYGDFPNVQIDYILASTQFDVKNYNIIDKKLSDHYAVMSDLSLKQ